MQIEKIFGPTINLLGKAVDLRAQQHNIVSSNIANAETPSYVPKSLSFEEELQGAVKSGGKGRQVITHPRHIPLKGASGDLQSVTGKVLETPAKTPGKDGNAVELENEMTRMTENQIMYNASIQMLTKKFEGLKIAIREGK